LRGSVVVLVKDALAAVLGLYPLLKALAFTIALVVKDIGTV